MSLARTNLKMRSSRSSSLGKTLFLIAAMALAVAACSRLPVYSHYEHIDGESWRRDDTLTFTTTVRDSANYHLILGLRATNAYPYKQLTVNVDMKVNENENQNENEDENEDEDENEKLTPHTSPLTIDITDAEGEMQGSGNTIYSYDVPIGDVVLGSSDTLTVSIHHAMSKFSLPGITDIGLTVAQ